MLLFLLFLDEVALDVLVHLEHIHLLGLIALYPARPMLFRHAIKYRLFIIRVFVPEKVLAFAFDDIDKLKFAIVGLLSRHKVRPDFIVLPALD
jgi:hypothetical protein